MRALLLVPIVLIIAFTAAAGICRAAGIDPHVKDLLAATLTCIVAGELAAVPLVLTRGGSQASVVQAALVGSVVHLFVCIAVAGIIVMARLGAGPAFLYWLLGLYWVTLVALLTAFVKAIRTAQVAQAPRQQGI